MDYEVGTGIYCSVLALKRPFKLAEYCSNFQAKVFAVRKAADIATNIKIINLRVYIESQMTVEAIISHRNTSENVLKSREAVDVVSTEKRLHIYEC